MKFTSLKLAVEMEGAEKVSVRPTELQEHTFLVSSQEYELKKNWIIKGEYALDIENKTLLVTTLEEGLEVTIPRPSVNGEKLPETAKAEEKKDTLVSAIVFHRATLVMAGKDVLSSHVQAFAAACIEGFVKSNPSASQALGDFGVIEIDWTTKNVKLKSIAAMIIEKAE